MHISIFLLLFSSFMLGFAYISQYFFGLEPCILCIYQRIPFFIVIALSLISFIAHGKARLLLVILCGISIMAGAGIAIFHVGVENGVFEMTEGCLSNNNAKSLDEIYADVLGKTNAPCNKVQFKFLGLSMAGWNFFISSIVGFFTLWICVNTYRREKWRLK